MSTTVIDNLQSNNATPPSGPYIRVIGSLNETTGKVSVIDSNPDGGLRVAPSFSSADSFSRVRMSAPFSLFDSKQIYAKDTTFWTESLVTGGTSTYLTNQAAVQLQVTTTNASSVIRQTRSYWPYQPGRSQLIFITGLMGAIKANVRQRIGYFDSNNGAFFEQNGTALRVVRRTFVTGSAVDNAVDQASWNIDLLNGTGQSGYNLDTSKIQLFVIDLSWLGAGIIRLGVVVNNVILYCHQFVASNTLTDVSMSNPSLPIRFEITNTAGTASSTSMNQISAAVFSEGGSDPVGLIVSGNTGATATVVTATETAIMGVRLNSTYNRAAIEPKSFEILSTSANNLIIRAYIRATLTGGSWVATTGVASEINITPSGFTTTNATLIATDYVNTSTTRQVSNLTKSSLNLGADFAGTTRDEFIVTVQNLSAGNNNTYAALIWKEIY